MKLKNSQQSCWNTLNLICNNLMFHYHPHTEMCIHIYSDLNILTQKSELPKHTFGRSTREVKLSMSWTDQRTWASSANMMSGHLTLQNKKEIKMKKKKKNFIKIFGFTSSSVDVGQPLQELQLTHKTSLPVSICT